VAQPRSSTASSTPSTAESYEDKNDDEAEDEAAKKNKTGHMAPSISGDSQQQMINLTACEFHEFQAYMIGQYGEKQFKEGFALIKANRNMFYEENGEQKLGQLLGML